MKKFLGCMCILLLALVACNNGQKGNKDEGNKIRKITIDGKEPVEGIKEVMDFGKTEAKKVKVVVEASSKDADVTYKKLFGDDFLKYLYGEDELRAPLKDKFSEDNFGKRMNDDSVLGLFVGLKSTIVTIFESQKYKEIDPEGHLSKFFTKDNGKNAALLVD